MVILLTLENRCWPENLDTKVLLDRMEGVHK
jgi:hypothetical protein